MSITEQEKKNIVEALIERIQVQSPSPSGKYSAEASFARLMAKISTNDHSTKIFLLRIRQYQIGLVAATAALLIAIGCLLYTSYEDGPSFIVATNNTGKVQSIPLSDGTIIKLNNRSKLTYPETFGGSWREVFLDGEAYFDVAHDKKRPFIVRAGELKIKVLGTKFTVNAASLFPKITATLLEGSIDVSNPQNHLLMKPSQQLTYDAESGKMLLANLNNAEREIRWTQNVWVLTDTPLLDICQRLERQFNVKFIIMNDKLINKSFTGEFETNESLESILETMKISTSFSYERTGKNIIMR
jgi:transmembrane sensor